MSIFGGLFGGTTSSQAPASASAPQAQVQAPQASQTQAQASQAPASASAPQPQAPQNPLDAFASLWESSPQQSPKPSSGLDMQKFAEVMKGIDYARYIPQESLQKAVGGDVSAFADVFNTVVRAGVMQSVAIAEKLVSSMLSQQLRAYDSTLDGRLKSMAVNDSLISSNPQFNHPALKPMIDALRGKFTEKFPTATAAEITRHITEYLSSIAPHFSGKQQEPTQQKAPIAGTDFSLYFANG